jgi:hypothetical protein
MQKDAGSGKENIDTEDMIIPRVALTQSLSDQVTEGLVGIGHFWHTILEEDLGETLEDLVVVHHSKRYVLWSPRHMGGGILARASDGRNWDKQFVGMKFEVQPSKDRPRHKVIWEIDSAPVGRDVGLGAWGTTDPDEPDSPPAATLTHVLVCVLLSRPEIGPFTILLQRTAEKVGKDLVTKINLDQAPIYGQVYKLSCKDDKAGNNEFLNYKFTKNGHVGTEDEYEACKKWNDMFTELGVTVDDSKDLEGANKGGATKEKADKDAKDF